MQGVPTDRMIDEVLACGLGTLDVFVFVEDEGLDNL